MKVVGLITEYNPFHNGHKYHIEQAKKLTGADYAVVVMSGNYVQRGGPAIVDKYARTKMALSCGADLVFELPVTYATASAEFFALGAVNILDQLGFVDCLCFGSECGDVSLLTAIADILTDEPEEYKTLLQQYTKQGSSFPAARQQALADYIYSMDLPKEQLELLLDALVSPNNILGIEYIKAIKRLKSNIEPTTITRICSGYHETELTGRISSASSIRHYLHEASDLDELKDTIPEEAFPAFQHSYETFGPMVENAFSNLLYYKLLYLSKEELTTYLDVNEDIAARIQKLLPSFTTISEFVELLKTKNLTHTRINRILFHILLNIKKDLFTSKKEEFPIYLRLLGMRRASSFLLKNSSSNAKVPVITKLAAAKKLISEESYEHLQLELLSTTLYNQVRSTTAKEPIKDEYRHGVVIQ